MTSIKRGISPLVALAFALILAGGIPLLLGAATATTWLQVVGGPIMGAGFAVLVSTITGQSAVHEQYAKEANLKRKTEVYGPLHAELKRLTAVFEQARAGAAPCPQWIALGDEDGSARSTLRAYDVPTLQWWPQFTEDYRSEDFTPSTRHLLDETHNDARAYNAAVDAARGAAADIITPHVQRAIEEVAARPEYAAQAQDDKTASRGSDPHGWFQGIRKGLEDTTPPRTPAALAQMWAAAWLEAWPLEYQPATFGWLLARVPTQAAHCVHAGYRPVLMPEPPPFAWFERIFRDAWPAIESDPACIPVWKAEDALRHSLSQSEAKLRDALRNIQQRYEGGPPPI